MNETWRARLTSPAVRVAAMLVVLVGLPTALLVAADLRELNRDRAFVRTTLREAHRSQAAALAADVSSQLRRRLARLHAPGDSQEAARIATALAEERPFVRDPFWIDPDARLNGAISLPAPGKVADLPTPVGGGDPEAAEAELRSAARAEFGERDRAAASAAYRRALLLAADPGIRAHAAFALGRLAEKAGKPAEAAPYYRAASQILGDGRDGRGIPFGIIADLRLAAIAPDPTFVATLRSRMAVALGADESTAFGSYLDRHLAMRGASGPTPAPALLPVASGGAGPEVADSYFAGGTASSSAEIGPRTAIQHPGPQEGRPDAPGVRNPKQQIGSLASPGGRNPGLQATTWTPDTVALVQDRLWPLIRGKDFADPAWVRVAGPRGPVLFGVAGSARNGYVGFRADFDGIASTYVPRWAQKVGLDTAARASLELEDSGPPASASLAAALEAPFEFARASIELKEDAVDARLQAQSRRSLVALGLLLAAIGAGAWALYRGITRELAFARMQAAFVAGVSHELKTPLTAIKMYADLLALGMAKDPEAATRTLVAEGDRLTRLIDRVLDFARIQRGTKTYNATRVEVGEVVAEALAILDPSIQEGGFRIAVQVEDGVPPVKADRDAILQVLLNLLSNAMKYSGEARDIKVAIRKSSGKVPGDRPGAVAIVVQDHGIGISRRDLGRIFEPFQRAVPTNGPGGSGLGLALVKEYVGAHGGEIKVESEEGAGSTFTVVWPAWPERGTGKLGQEGVGSGPLLVREPSNEGARDPMIEAASEARKEPSMEAAREAPEGPSLETAEEARKEPSAGPSKDPSKEA